MNVFYIQIQLLYIRYIWTRYNIYRLYREIIDISELERSDIWLNISAKSFTWLIAWFLHPVPTENKIQIYPISQSNNLAALQLLFLQRIVPMTDVSNYIQPQVSCLTRYGICLQMHIRKSQVASRSCTQPRGRGKQQSTSSTAELLSSFQAAGREQSGA